MEATAYKVKHQWLLSCALHIFTPILGLLLGASAHMNIPVVDADWMGRAYPVSWQITPVVWGGDGAQFIPQVIADGNGNVMV